MIIKTYPFSRPMNPMYRAALVACARTFIGVRFVHQGRTRNGVDCLGLLLLVVNEVLDTDLRVSGYEHWPNPSELRKLLRQFLISSGKFALKPGDIILLRSELGPTHWGWYTGDSIIHADGRPTVMRVVEQTLHEDRTDIVGYFKVPEYELK